MGKLQKQQKLYKWEIGFHFNVFVVVFVVVVVVVSLPLTRWDSL